MVSLHKFDVKHSNNSGGGGGGGFFKINKVTYTCILDSGRFVQVASSSLNAISG